MSRARVAAAALLILVAGVLPALAADPGPEPGEDRVVPGARVVLRGVEFGFDTAYIDPASRTTLELVAEALERRPDVRVRIEGHTCNMGSVEYNRELSEQRADAVKRILVGYGVAGDRFEIVGFGEAQPVADNDSDEGRALNRRVELVIIEVE